MIKKFSWMPIGLCLGCAYGLIFHNFAFGIALGLLYGLAMGFIAKKDK